MLVILWEQQTNSRNSKREPYNKHNIKIFEIKSLKNLLIMTFATYLYCYLFYGNDKQTAERSKGSHSSALHNITKTQY